MARTLARLVGFEGPEDSLAERLAFQEEDESLAAELVTCLQGGELAEVQALRALVRILGTLAGDATGDTTPDTSSSGSRLAQAIRSEAVTLAVLDLLQHRWAKFPAEERPWLLLEGLRSLRLLLLVPADALNAQQRGLRPTAAWWIEDDLGYQRHGAARRRLGEVLLLMLETLKGSGSSEMKLAAFAAARNLIRSPGAFRHLAQTEVASSVVQLMQGQKVFHACLPEGCRLLTQLCAGPRLHLRKVVEAQAPQLAMELLRRMEAHREVAASSFVLLAVTGHQEALELCASAAKSWPQQVREELGPKSVDPAFRALLGCWDEEGQPAARLLPAP